MGPGAAGCRERLPTRPCSNLIPHAEPLQPLCLQVVRPDGHSISRVLRDPSESEVGDNCVASRLRPSRWTTSSSAASRSRPGVLAGILDAPTQPRRVCLRSPLHKAPAGTGDRRDVARRM